MKNKKPVEKAKGKQEQGGEKESYTKYEIARLIGARALQIAMGAPMLVDLKQKDLEEINYNPVEIAKIELKHGVLPITIKRPMPKKVNGNN